MSKPTKIQYWATIFYIFFYFGVLILFSSLVFRSLMLNPREQDRISLVVLECFFFIIFFSFLTQLVKDAKPFRGASQGLVATIWQAELDRIKASRIYKEPEKFTGLRKRINAWLLPGSWGMIGVLGITLISLILIKGGPEPVPVGFVVTLTLLIFSLSIAPIFCLLVHCRKIAKQKQISLTDALYGWNYDRFQKKPALQQAQAKPAPKRVVISLCAIAFGISIAALVAYYKACLKMTPFTLIVSWAFLFIGGGGFLRAIRYGDKDLSTLTN